MILWKRAEIKSARPPARVKSVNTATAWDHETPSQDGLGVDVLQRQAACACGGGCPRCAPVQAKLMVNQPGDRYEQEADRVAEQVMRMPDPGIQRQVEPLADQVTPLIQRQVEPEEEWEEEPEEDKEPKEDEEQEEGEEEEEPIQPKRVDQITPLVQRQAEPEEEEEEETVRAKPLMHQSTPLVQRQVEPEEEEEPIQAKVSDGAQLQRQEEPPRETEEEEEVQAKSKVSTTPTVTPSIESRINSLKGGGQPLDTATRNFFEPRFDHDFSEVRVHTDNQAADTARSINARAFTQGRNVVFDSGQYSPGSRSGRSLLAHELTHVVQQNGRQFQRAQSLKTGEAIQYATSVRPDAQMNGGLEIPGEGMGASGVRSDGAARHGLGQGGVAARSAGVYGNLENKHLNFQYSRVQANQHRQWVAASLRREGNDSATPSIQRAPSGAKAKAPIRKDYIFIMGRDPWRCRRTRRGRRRCRRVTGFYALASRYYRYKAPGARLISDQRSLSAVLSYVAGLKQPVGNLYLVSHANKDGTLSFPISGAYKKGSKTTFKELKDALALPQVSRQIIDQHTTIHIKGCDIGRAKRMLDLIDEKFGGKGTVVAPTHKQVYGPKRGRGTPYEAFKGYFVERRGAVKLRSYGLLAAFRHKYPHLTAQRLRKLLSKVKRRVTSRTAITFNVYLPTKRQARWRSVRRRWFSPRGYVKIGGERYKVDGLNSYEKLTAGIKVNHVYTYKAKRKGRRTSWVSRTVAVPTHKKAKSDGIKWANANLARSAMYAWKVRAKRKRLRIIIRVIGRMTEYRIRKEFTMPGRVKKATYYGRSSFTP